MSTQVEPANSIEPVKPLTAKQQRFVLEYCVDFNGHAAAVRAGYRPDWARKVANKLLRRPAVQVALAAKQHEHATRLDITAERVLRGLAAIAFQDYRSYQRLVRTIHPDGRIEEHIENVPTDQQSDEQAAAVAGYKETVNEAGYRCIEVKLHDKPAALMALAKHLGLFGPDAAVQVNVLTAEMRLDTMSEEALHALVARIQR